MYPFRSLIKMGVAQLVERLTSCQEVIGLFLAQAASFPTSWVNVSIM